MSTKTKNVKTDVLDVKTKLGDLDAVRQVVLDNLVANTNKAGDTCVRAVNKAQRKFFEVVRDCVREMDGNTDELKKYRKGLKTSHKSTVTVMMKVASNKFLMRLEDQLPTSYQTLYEMTKLVEEVGEDRFTELLDETLLSKESSKAQVTERRKVEKSLTSSTEDEDVTTCDNEDNEEVKTVDYLTDEVLSLPENDRFTVVERVLETMSYDELENLMSLLQVRVEGSYDDFEEAA
ncbi:hypothetical protein N9V47_09655 [Luminiphilus sp.]|nr:hypothetical protein [Luminiphilus sp.]